ncbi:DUF2150 family protein [Natronocalculus amylovorans]|uniref:DUF2150 family protein n=1 Tax=Natronocalculus amylovorans TaxID=2917812 RepID=A0AAE3K860_9EURY|nr:DUF2150 family protein [Natronocalculus amylovorans]MCL9816701.1 DUF2150 family protein [Natronocalculus amylovorans]NUE01144.1 DUF2150 family protein [Halorubraceae archaeon YAN]
MSDEPAETFYSEERWQNWLTRVEEEELDPENEDSARLLINLQDDAAIAVVKVLTAFDDDRIDEELAVSKLGEIREIVLAQVEFEDEEKTILIDGVQTSLVPVFYAAEEFIIAGESGDAPVDEYIAAAADAEASEELDAALSYIVQAGTLIIAGEELDMSIAEELEYGLVAEWVNGLDSLQSALSDPEVVEED